MEDGRREMIVKVNVNGAKRLRLGMERAAGGRRLGDAGELVGVS